jgi:TRAP-type C4-dicarboxylate transport system substrate-binding protein
MIMKLFLSLALLSFSISLMAKTQLKLAALVPEGTTWGLSLKKLSKEIDAATAGEVTFKVYYGGVAGDEPDVLRKIRIGQYHGGIFTGKTLGDISGDVRVMETPFSFYGDQKKAAAVMQRLTPVFNQKLKEKGFINLGFYEVGLVYLVSTRKITSLEELKGIKIWSWEGDELVKAMIESLQLVSVPLALPDVLSSLSTGIINAAYAPPLGILALQWQTKVKYLVDFPTAFSMGALVVSAKTWSQIKPEHQQIILGLSEKMIKEANDKSIADNEDARGALKKSGVEFVSFAKGDYEKAAALRSQVVNKLKDKLISAKMFEEFDKEIKK